MQEAIHIDVAGRTCSQWRYRSTRGVSLLERIFVVWRYRSTRGVSLLERILVVWRYRSTRGVSLLERRSCNDRHLRDPA